MRHQGSDLSVSVRFVLLYQNMKTEQTVEKTSVSFTPLGGSRYEVRGFASHLHHLWVEGKGKKANLAALNSLKLVLMYP